MGVCAVNRVWQDIHRWRSPVRFQKDQLRLVDAAAVCEEIKHEKSLRQIAGVAEFLKPLARLRVGKAELAGQDLEDAEKLLGIAVQPGFR